MLAAMARTAYPMSQPGRTGNLGALRIVKAAQRTSSSVDPTGRRSAVVSLRSISSSVWGFTLRLPPPVSMGLRTIETGGAKLAQRQNPRAFPPNDLRYKSPKSAFGAARSSRLRPQAPDPRAMQRRLSLGANRRSEWTSMSRPAVGYRQPQSRAITAQRGRRSVRLNTNRIQDRFGTDRKSRASSAPG